MLLILAYIRLPSWGIDYGKAFMQLDEIDAIDMEHGFDSVLLRNSTATLLHHCPEIREPITFPKWVGEIIAAYYPDKVLRATNTDANRSS